MWTAGKSESVVERGLLAKVRVCWRWTAGKVEGVVEDEVLAKMRVWWKVDCWQS